MATVQDRADYAPTDPALDSLRTEITPSDTLVLASPVEALIITEAGDVTMALGNEAPVTVTYEAGGPYYVGQVNRIYSTGTDATGIIGITAKALR
jgi:hypothetical protein